MQTRIYINLPTQDLTKATAFYEEIGFTKNPQFSDENASGFAFDDTIHLMVLTNEYFKSFMPHKEVSDTKKTSEVMNALQQSSKEKVDSFVQKALDAGANEFRPASDHGFMYGRAFEDLDGHIREVFWMDPTQMPAN